jgi:4-amino-4-deoxy-L-arabinose transferase-like glycosyltransferase
MSANAFIFAATVVTVFWLVLRLRGRLRHAVATAVLTGFCTSLLPSN